MNIAFCKATTRRFFVAICLAAFVAASPVKAAEPLATICLKPTDELLGNLKFLFQATGTDQIAQFVMPQVEAYLNGIDGTRPMGMVVSAEGMEFTPLGIVPVTNLKGFLGQLENQIGTPADAGNGVLELRGPQPVFVKEQGEWAFVGQNVESLSDLPANPLQILDGLHEQYDLAVRFNVRNIPAQLKEMAIGQISAGLNQGLANQSDEASRQMAEAQVAQLKQMIEEAGDVTLGLRIDAEDQVTYLDFLMTAQPGTGLAEQMATAADATTDFSGFRVDDAAITANFAGVMKPEQIKQSIVALQNVEKSALEEIDNDADLPNEGARKAAKELISTFFGIVRSTVKSGKMDSSTSIILKPKAMTMVSAARVADGSEVESAVKQLVEMAENEPEITFSNVKFNADKHAGVSFHTLAMPIPPEEYVHQVLGDQLEVVVGTGEETAFIALGTDGIKHLKQMIDASASTKGTKSDPFEAVVALQPILEFADSIESNPLVSALAQSLSESAGKDHIKIHVTAIENGVKYRILIEEGVLRLVGQGVQMGGAGGF